jgi:hypothetical protein
MKTKESKIRQRAVENLARKCGKLKLTQTEAQSNDTETRSGEDKNFTLNFKASAQKE